MNYRTLTACSVTALTAALLAGNAEAVSISDTPQISVYEAGASAAQPIIGAVTGQILQPGYIVIEDDGGTPNTFTDDGKNYTAYLGLVIANPPAAYSTLAGKEVLFISRGLNGQIDGSVPVAAKIGIQNLAVSASCTQNTTATSTTYQYACPAVGDDTNGNSNPLNRIPDFGVLDTEPGLGEGPYNTDVAGLVTSTPITPAQVASLSVNLSHDLIFGVPLTNTIPTGTYLSSAAISGVLTGDLATWSQVNPSLSSLSNQGVVVCRRNQGSGTSDVFNNWFTHFPCEAQGGQLPLGNVPPAVAADSYSIVLATATGAGTQANPYIVNASDGYTVAEANSNGNERACLTAAQNGGNYPANKNNALNPYLAADGFYYVWNFGSGGYGAIGELSYDNVDYVPPIAGSSPGWYFASVDGVAPNLANAQSLQYPFVNEATDLYLKTYPAGLNLTFIKYYISEAQQATVLASVNDTGVKEAELGNPTIAGNHTTSANVLYATKNGNSCKPWVLQY